MEVLVFRTGVNNTENIDAIAGKFNSMNGIHKWSFDFDDNERILRVESVGISPREIENVLTGMNYYCEELPD